MFWVWLVPLGALGGYRLWKVCEAGGLWSYTREPFRGTVDFVLGCLPFLLFIVMPHGGGYEHTVAPRVTVVLVIQSCTSHIINITLLRKVYLYEKIILRWFSTCPAMR